MVEGRGRQSMGFRKSELARLGDGEATRDFQYIIASPGMYSVQ